MRLLCLATAASCLGGVALAQPSQEPKDGKLVIPITITPHSFAITLGATVGVGLLCALYPAWRASTRAPTVALGRH